MGCTLRILPGAGGAYVGEAGMPRLDYETAGGPNRGSLCAKGNMALELLLHPRRLDAPQVRSDGQLRPVGWDAALGGIAERLQAVVRDAGPRAVGFWLGAQLTSEEAAAAADLARALGCGNVDGGDPEDLTLRDGIQRSRAGARPVEDVAQLEAMACTLVVGDLFTLAPCLAKPVLHARYDRRQNQLATLSGVPNRTAWFGKPDLRCRPAREAAALAVLLRAWLPRCPADLPWLPAARELFAEVDADWLEQHAGLRAAQVQGFLDALAAAPQRGVLVGATFGASERGDLVGGLAALFAEASGSRFLALNQGANLRGVRQALAARGYPDPAGLTAPQMLEAAMTGGLRALVVLGCDPLAALPGSSPAKALAGLELLVVSAPMPGATGDKAHYVLPGAAFGEKTGTTTNGFGTAARLCAALPAPGAARSEGWLLEQLAARLGVRGTGAAGPRTASAAPRPDAGFFAELALFLQQERREGTAQAAGSHLLLPAASPAQAGDGSLTRWLSWPAHEAQDGCCVLSAAHAQALGVRAGDRVRLRGPAAEAVLAVRIEPRLPPGVVLAPPHDPAVRRLVRWRVDPVRRDLDLEPGRVSVEPLGAGT